MLYFLAATSIPVIKVGHSVLPLRRLSNCSAWSPVPLHILAVDQSGDSLTEAEILDRFRAYRSHGEWLFATPEVRHLVAETKRTGRVPGGWYMPAGYDRRRFLAEVVRGPTHAQIMAAYGLTMADIRAAVGSRHLPRSPIGIPAVHIVPIVKYLRDHGHQITHTDLLRIRDELPAGVANGLAA